MNELIVGTDREGNIVALPIQNVLYILQQAGWTDIHLHGGATVTVNETLEQLGFAILRPEQLQERTEEGATPSPTL